MTARKLGGVWFVDFYFTHINGPRAGRRERIRKRSPVDTKRGAQDYERLLRERLLQGKPLDPSEEAKVTPTCAAFFTEWLDTYALTNNKPSSAEAKRSIVRVHLAPFFGRMKLTDVGVREIERYKAAKVKQELAAKSINNHLTVLRRALVSAEEWGHVPHVPTVKWMRTDPPTFDFFTRDESERLLAATPREHLAIVATALKAGLRRGELLALEWQDIDLVSGKVLVRRSVWRGKVTAPKSGKHREVAMSPQLARILKAHRHLRGRLVFSSADGSMLSKDMVKRILPAACRRAGLREIQWHVLRHSFASHLVMANVPLKAVQELLGHATIDVTMRYAHLAPGVHSDAVARLDAPAAHEEKVGQLLGNDGRVVP